MGKRSKNGKRRNVQVRDAVVKILKDYPDGLTTIQLAELIPLKNYPQGKSLGMVVNKTPGVEIIGTERIASFGHGHSEYSIFALTDESEYNRWRYGLDDDTQSR